MTSYRPAVFSSARTAGSIHHPVAIQRSRIARAARAPDRLAPPYTTRRGILFKTLGLAPVISSSHSLSRVPLYLLYPLEQPLDSPIHRRASSDPQRGISRILKWRLISGQFHPVTQLSSHHFRFHDEAIFRGLRGCFWWRLSSQANGNPCGEGGD